VVVIQDYRYAGNSRAPDKRTPNVRQMTSLSRSRRPAGPSRCSLRANRHFGPFGGPGAVVNGGSQTGHSCASGSRNGERLAHTLLFLTSRCRTTFEVRSTYMASPVPKDLRASGCSLNSRTSRIDDAPVGFSPTACAVCSSCDDVPTVRAISSASSAALS
jgi:hypothetical protein